MSDSFENAVTGRRVSRRWLLRSTARLTAGVVAAGSVSVAAAPETAETTTVPPDHDAATGEIFDRARHHHWDTV